MDLTTAPNNKTPNWHQRCSCGSGCLRSLGARDVCVIVYVSLLTCFFIPSSGQKSVTELERFMNIANIYMLMNAAQLLKTSALWSNFSFDACELRQALVTSSPTPFFPFKSSPPSWGCLCVSVPFLGAEGGLGQSGGTCYCSGRVFSLCVCVRWSFLYVC